MVNLKDVKVGQQYAVNRSPDGQVYTVDEIDGVNVKLGYMASGEKRSGGWIDYSVLMKPSKAQLALYEKTSKA